jgi:hypothetical protein
MTKRQSIKTYQAAMDKVEMAILFWKKNSLIHDKKMNYFFTKHSYTNGNFQRFPGTVGLGRCIYETKRFLGKGK